MLVSASFLDRKLLEGMNHVLCLSVSCKAIVAGAGRSARQVTAAQRGAGAEHLGRSRQWENAQDMGQLLSGKGRVDARHMSL